MAAEASRFQAVEDIPAPPQPDHAAATAALMLALKSLSQRALIAVDNLFCLITVGLVFWLYKSVPDPNTYQLVGLGLFALFVLAANVIVRRGK